MGGRSVLRYAATTRAAPTARNCFATVTPWITTRVSPAYDLPSSHPYGDYTTALSIGGKTDERIGRSDFVALGESVAVRARATERTLSELIDRTDDWLPRLDDLPFEARTLHKLRCAIEYRRERLR